MSTFNIKANRVFTLIRKTAWLITLLVAIGGLFYPKLGLLAIAIILSLTIMSFFSGRMWCGNFCPHGSLYDYLALPLSLNRKIPAVLTSVAAAVLVFGWFGFSMSKKLIKVFSIFGTGSFLDKLGSVFVTTYLMVLIVGGLLSIFVAPRTWCQFCPMGTIQRLSYKLGKLLGVAKKTDRKITIASKDKCHSCAKCSRVCPMQLAPYQEFSDKNQFDNEKCIRCSTCVVNCPAGLLTLSNEKQAVEIKAAEDLEGYENRKKITAVITGIKKLNDDVTEYTFRCDGNKTMNYKAGQFVLVKVLDKPAMSRAFSISSYYEDGRSLSVTVKNIKDGYGSGIIADNFKLGIKVELDGPMGKDLVVDKSVSKVLLIAGGIGITPFLPIVRDLMRSGNNVEEVSLVYGVNNQKEFIYTDEFIKLEQQYEDRFRFVQVVTFDEAWEGKKGFVTNVIQEMNLEGYKVYMCGPKPMVNAALKVLKENSVSDEDIFMESA